MAMTDSQYSRSGSFRRIILVLVALLVIGTTAFGGLATVNASVAGAQVTPLDDEPDNDSPGLGRITGTPDPGPAPEDAGDRGGAAQLALAVVLFSGLLFIGWRIRTEVRRNRASNGQNPRSV